MLHDDLSQDVPRSLPLVDAFVAAQAGARLLEGVTAVLIQHQLGSVVPMTRALIELGLDARRIHFVDIPYTANAVVRAELEALGIPATQFAPSDYTLAEPYARHQRRRVQEVAARLRDRLRPGEPLLVLDDGAYFLEAMSCFAHPLGDLHAVEQTTRGMIKLETDPAIGEYAGRFPVIDVARSQPKTRWEGPWIGEAVCRSLRRSLGDELAMAPGDRCLVLGYGTIGRAVALSLVEDLGLARTRVHVLDEDPNAMRAALDDGFAPWRRDARQRLRFTLVVGCTGQTSFCVGDRVFLEDGAVLASASSGSAELSREGFVELAETHPSDDIEVLDAHTLATRDVHAAIDLRLVDRTVRMLNGGFPVNFDGRVNCVAPERIQVTRALMLAAALQAMRTDGSGVLALDRDACDWVDRTYSGMLAPA